jgi:hypothetical protein
MANQCFDIAHIRHVGKRRNGIPNLYLMHRMQFQELLNGLSSPLDAVHGRI